MRLCRGLANTEMDAFLAIFQVLQCAFHIFHVFQCRSGCPGTHSVDQAGLELRNLFSTSVFLGPGIVSHETAISGSFQQNLASVCNGVSVWKLIMGWIPGYGNH